MLAKRHLRRWGGRPFEPLEQRCLLNAAPVGQSDQYSMLAGESLRLGMDLPYGIVATAEAPDGHLYGAVVQWLNWPTARDEAAAKTFKGVPGHLVTFGSAAEHQFVMQNLVARMASEFNVADIWIGLSDVAQEGNFQWVTGEPRTFTSWSPGEPNSLGDEDAVEMYTNGKWNDVLVGDGSTAYIVEFDGPFQTGVLTNDTDADADLLTAQLMADAAHGELQLLADGAFTYVPDAGFVGVDTFTYRASDGQATSAVKTVSINVQSNSTPVATGESFEMLEETTLTIGNRLPAGVTPMIWPTNGHAYMQVNADVNWEQAVAGAASWEYHGATGHLISVTSSAENDFMLTRVMRRINDEQYYLGLSDIETEGTFKWTTGEPLSFTAWGPGEPNNSAGLEDAVELYPYYGNIWNDVPPTDVNSGYFVEFEAPLHGGVLKNDFDAEGRRLYAQLVDDVQHGALALADDGTLTYTPDADYSGVDSFTYRASDGNTASNLATVKINVTRFNSAPVAAADRYLISSGVTRDVPVENGVLINDADAEADVLVAELLTSPTHGALTLAPDGSFRYVPTSGYLGVDTFTYRALDATLASAPVTVSLEISPNADQRVARDDMYRLGEDLPLVVGPVSDVRAGLIHEWRFDETAGLTAADSVAGNDATLTGWSSGEDRWSTGRVGGSLDFNRTSHYVRTKSGIDAEEYTISFWLRVDALTGINPRIATPSGSGGIVINNESGRGVGFYYNHGQVLASDPQAPQIGVWEHYAMAFDFADQFARIYRNGVEVAAAAAASGLFEGPWVFGHDQNVSNTFDTLNGALDELRIYDRELTPQEIAQISVTPGPLANDIVAYEPVPQSGAQFEAVSEPSHGKLTWQPDGGLTYAPNANFVGVDSFQYRFVQNGIPSNVAVVSLNVTSVNDRPIGNPDAYGLPLGAASISIAAANGVLANDTDEEDGNLTATFLTAPAHGRVRLAADGSFIYSAYASFNEADSFQYRVFDGAAYSLPVTVTVALDIPRITVGNHTLLPDTPNQSIQLFISGGQAISGLNLFTQVGDGGPERTVYDLPAGVDGPAITAIDIKTGTVFAGLADPAIVELAIPQVASAQISIAQPQGTVPASGLLATITIDTTGLYGGTWDLLLNNVLAEFSGGPFTTDFAGLPAIIDNGKLIIEEATIVSRQVFYAGSAYGDAPAADKQVLLPGQTATFANYSSYVGGINGIAVDIADPLGAPSLADFAFYVGNSNDTSTWTAAPTPISWSSVIGENGGRRLNIRWADGAITNRWLMVRVKSTINTGLAHDDIFYFGNAIGESGDNALNALVNATDVVGTRDNPNGPLNPATMENRFDFNRDRLVNATDLVIARDHATSPLTALRLITPSGEFPTSLRLAPPSRNIPPFTLPKAADLAHRPADKLARVHELATVDALFSMPEIAPAAATRRRTAARR